MCKSCLSWGDHRLLFHLALRGRQRDAQVGAKGRHNGSGCLNGEASRGCDGRQLHPQHAHNLPPVRGQPNHNTWSSTGSGSIVRGWEPALQVSVHSKVLHQSGPGAPLLSKCRSMLKRPLQAYLQALGSLYLLVLIGSCAVAEGAVQPTVHPTICSCCMHAHWQQQQLAGYHARAPPHVCNRHQSDPWADASPDAPMPASIQGSMADLRLM